jgi:hypothetical protein
MGFNKDTGSVKTSHNHGPDIALPVVKTIATMVPVENLECFLQSPSHSDFGLQLIPPWCKGCPFSFWQPPKNN